MFGALTTYTIMIEIELVAAGLQVNAENVWHTDFQSKFIYACECAKRSKIVADQQTAVGQCI